MGFASFLCFKVHKKNDHKDMIYISITILSVVSAIFSQITSMDKRRFVPLVILIAMFLLSYLRGMSGTDTNTYTSLANAILAGVEVGVEPGFKVFTVMAGIVADDSHHIVRLFSVILFIFIAAFLFKSDRNQLIYISVYFIPQFYINYSMNAIREGVALSAFLLFYQNFVSRKYIWAALFFFISASFHYSIFLCFALLSVPVYLNSRIPSIYKMIPIIILVSFAAFVSGDYLTTKADQYLYGDMSAKSMGISSSIKILIVIMSSVFLPIESRKKILFNILVIAVCVPLVYLSTVNYAGTRIMNQVAWILPLLYIYLLGDRYMGVKFSYGLLVAGIFGAISSLNNILSDFYGPSPFTPYLFVWE